MTFLVEKTRHSVLINAESGQREMLNRGRATLLYKAPELKSEETIGDPSEPMSDFEKVIRRSWHMNGGSGNPPKVIVSKSLHDDMAAMGCPEHLMTVMRSV